MKSFKVSEDHFGKNKKSLYDNMMVKWSDREPQDNFSCYGNIGEFHKFDNKLTSQYLNWLTVDDDDVADGD